MVTVVFDNGDGLRPLLKVCVMNEHATAHTCRLAPYTASVSNAFGRFVLPSPIPLIPGATMPEPSGIAEWDKIPASVRVLTILLSFVAIIIIVFCLTRRIQTIKSWTRLSAPTWLLIITYVDSGLFILTTTVLSKSFSLDHSFGLCDAAIILCGLKKIAYLIRLPLIKYKVWSSTSRREFSCTCSLWKKW